MDLRTVLPELQPLVGSHLVGGYFFFTRDFISICATLQGELQIYYWPL